METAKLKTFLDEVYSIAKSKVDEGIQLATPILKKTVKTSLEAASEQAEKLRKSHEEHDKVQTTATVMRVFPQIYEDSKYLRISWITHKLYMIRKKDDAVAYWNDNFEIFWAFVDARKLPTQGDFAWWTVYIVDEEDDCSQQTNRGGKIHPHIGCSGLNIRELMRQARQTDVDNLNHFVDKFIRSEYNRIHPESDEISLFEDVGEIPESRVPEIDDALADDAEYFRIVYITQMVSKENRKFAKSFWISNFDLYIKYLTNKIPKLNPEHIDELRTSSNFNLSDRLMMYDMLETMSSDQAEVLFDLLKPHSIYHDSRLYQALDTVYLKVMKKAKEELSRVVAYTSS